MTSHSLSILIVNFNTKELLRECLLSIFASPPQSSFEVIVVDRYSSDGSRAMVKKGFSQVRAFSFAPKRPYSEALNRYVPTSRGEYILISHADIVFRPGSLDRMVAFMENNDRVGIVGANQVYPDGTFVPCSIRNPSPRKVFRNMIADYLRRLDPSFRFRAETLERWGHKSTAVTEVVWACYVVRRTVFDAVGLFDEDFYYSYTNNDLCQRASAKGWSVVYLAEAPVVHYEIQTPRKIYGKEGLRYKRYGSAISHVVEKDFFHFISKYYGRRDRDLLKLIKGIDAFVKLFALLALRVFSPGQRAETSLKLQGHIGALRTILSA